MPSPAAKRSLRNALIGVGVLPALFGCGYFSESDGVILADYEQPGSALTCNADRYQSAIGLNVQDIIVNRDSGPVRVVWPWQTVITDLQPNRLNLIVAPDGTITNVTCG